MELSEVSLKPLLTSQTYADDAKTPQSPQVNPRRLSQALDQLAENRTRRYLQTFNGTVAGSWKGRWMPETWSCLFALLSIAGLILTLHAHGNKPLPDWPQLVSMNSIVSIFALLIRTSTGLVLAEGISQLKWEWFSSPRRLIDMERFDNASRGSWGSISFLGHLGWQRHANWIATLGALTTITLSLTGFSAQQIIQFQDCLQRDSVAAPSIARTNSYEAAGDATGPVSADPFTPMVAAINVGIIQPVEDETKVLSSNCPTGNCTFLADDGASLSTVGVTHHCENITSEIVQNRNESTYGSWIFNITTGRYTDRTTFVTLDQAGNVLSTGMGSGGLSTVKVLWRSSYTDMNASAVSCSIIPTINTYGVNISNGNLHESLVSSVPMGMNCFPGDQANKTSRNDTNSEAWWIPRRRATSQTLRNGRLVDCHRQETPAPGLFVVAQANIDAAPESCENLTAEAEKIWYYDSDCIWGIGMNAAQGIDDYLTELYGEGRMVWGGRLAGNYGSVYLRKLFQEGNITQDSVNNLFKSLTGSINAVIRTNGNPNLTAYATGDMWYTTTCMQINWAWISFPAMSIGLSILFLILVSLETRHVERDKLWKSSVLAPLYYEMDEPTVEQARPIGKRAMSDIAKSTSVSVKDDQNNLRLVTR